MPSVSHLGPTDLGLDVHKDTISVAILVPDRDGPDVELIAHDEVSVRRLVGRLPDRRWLRACYEAGPTGKVDNVQVADYLTSCHLGRARGDRPRAVPAPGVAG